MFAFEGEGGGGEVEVQGGVQEGGAEGAAQGGEQQGGAGTGEADPIARLMSSMETFQQDQVKRFETLEQRLPAPVQQEQQGDGGFDLAALLEELPDDAFDPETSEITAEGQMELMRQMARQEADAVRSEAAQERLQAEHDAYATHLEKHYPELASSDKQQEVFAEAQRLAKQMGQPALVSNPYFFEQTYLSMAAKSRAAAEVPAQDADRGVRLEQPGGGGGPVDNGNGPSAQQRIVSAATGSRFRLGT